MMSELYLCDGFSEISVLYRDRLSIDPKEHPMLLAEPSFNTQQYREK
jgi:hypothetical protein